nr:MAG TPA: hypothetical protein [Caudoviricetes sp.]
MKYTIIYLDLDDSTMRWGDSFEDCYKVKKVKTDKVETIANGKLLYVGDGYIKIDAVVRIREEEKE